MLVFLSFYCVGAWEGVNVNVSDMCECICYRIGKKQNLIDVLIADMAMKMLCVL